jgi:hypothetical protein
MRYLMVCVGVVATMSWSSPAAAQAARGTAAQSVSLAAGLRSAIAQTETELASAKADSAAYASGLVKALIESRVATLAQTLAMLKQRQATADFNIAIRYTVDGKLLVLPANAQDLIQALDSEIAAANAKIAEQQAEADRYSGGLVQAMALATVATSRQSLAMLEQKRLALKYGLPQFVGFADQQASGMAPAAHATAAPQVAPPFEIVSIDYRVTERNDVWSKFAWKLVLRNKSAQAAVFDATIEFQDADGFIVDTDTGRGLAVQASSDETFTGFALIRAESVAKVAKANAKVRVSR